MDLWALDVLKIRISNENIFYEYSDYYYHSLEGVGFKIKFKRPPKTPTALLSVKFTLYLEKVLSKSANKIKSSSHHTYKKFETFSFNVI